MTDRAQEMERLAALYLAWLDEVIAKRMNGGTLVNAPTSTQAAEWFAEWSYNQGVRLPDAAEQPRSRPVRKSHETLW